MIDADTEIFTLVSIRVLEMESLPLIVVASSL